MSSIRKKINCKHGLIPRQEIAARRLRAKLEIDPIPEEAKEMYHKYFESYRKYKAESFLAYLQDVDIIAYSALKRLEKSKQMHIIVKIIFKEGKYF